MTKRNPICTLFGYNYLHNNGCIIKLFLESISTPEEDSTFFKKLSTDLIIKEAVNDFHKCNSDRCVKIINLLIKLLLIWFT